MSAQNELRHIPDVTENSMDTSSSTTISNNPSSEPPEPLTLCVKPLPRIPSRWSRFCDQLSVFLRSIKLGIIIITFQGLFKRQFKEPTKVAIFRNRLSAFLRSIVHVLPLAIALPEIFAAKAHEIFIQASLAAAFFAYIRFQITIGEGLPFGALLGSVQFLEVSYLWSTEFWSAVLSKQFTRRKRLEFALMIFIFGLLAATAGPSSASLLIPRPSLWPIVPFQITMNGTSSDFWPDVISGINIPSHCAVIGLKSQETYPECPISDWAPNLKTPIPVFADFTPDGELAQTDVGNLALNYNKVIFSGLCASSSDHQFCATRPQEIFYPGMTDFPPVGVAGILPGDPTTYIDSYLAIKDHYFQPYTIASCVTNTYDGAMNQTNIQFARLLQHSSELQPITSRPIFPIPNLTVQQAIDTPGNASQYRTAWIDLPPGVFNTAIPGVMFIHPKNMTEPIVGVTTCTLNAGWGSSQLASHSSESNILYSRRATTPSGWPAEIAFDMDEAGYLQVGYPDFANLSGSPFPERRIKITHDWLDFFNPVVELFPGQNSTALNAALSALSDQFSEQLVARTMSDLLASALARTGLTMAFNTTLDSTPSSSFCDDCYTTKILRTDYAWTYQADSVGVQLSLVVMIAYCVLAAIHILYALIFGVSGSAWDSVAELVALAMNSKPTAILQNNCAGIIGMKAFKTKAQVLETTQWHLELCFEETEHHASLNSNSTSKVKYNEKYGTLSDKKRD